jgi:hypothetical protein
MKYSDACRITRTKPDLELYPAEKRAVILEVKRSRVRKQRRIATRYNCKIGASYLTSQLTRDSL